MKIDVLGSSSEGNCYIVEDQGQILILEAGVKIDIIKKALNFDFKRVNGCLVSHVHSDHSCAVGQLSRYGIHITSNGTVGEKYQFNNVYICEPDIPFSIGSFKVMAFNLVHDVENYGYIIMGPSGKKILFCTDTQFIQKQFKGVDIYMIECNFDMDSMRKAVNSGKIPPEVLIRTSNTHMSLETVLSYLKHAELSNTSEIVLIHLSNGNSNESKYIKAVQNATGIKCTAADIGTVIEILDGPGF